MRGMRGEREGGKGNERAENQKGTKAERLRKEGKLLKSNDPATGKQLFLSRMRIESMNPNSGKRGRKSRGQTKERARTRSALLGPQREPAAATRDGRKARKSAQRETENAAAERRRNKATRLERACRPGSNKKLLNASV